MKKTILFTALICASFITVKAQTISFETAEGYSLGNINGQNNWTTTGDGSGGFIANQTVSSDRYSTGLHSLKLANEPAYPGQTNAIVGAFYTYPTAIPNATATFSADINIDSVQGFTGLSFLMGLVDLSGDGAYRTYINFAYDGHVDVLVQGSTPGMIIKADAGIMWTANTWYNVKIETQGVIVRFYVNDVMIYTNNLVSNGPINQIRFAHDNYEGFVYVDNIRTNDEPLSIGNNTLSSVKHFYDRNTETLNINSGELNISNLTIYNTLGQEVLKVSSDNSINTVDLSKFSNGVYIVKLNDGTGSDSFKIAKN